MKVVWKLDSATVRDVYETLRARRAIAYTTVMTMMKILEEKGYLKKVRWSAPTSTDPRSHGSRSSAPWSATSSTACSTARPAGCCVHLAKDRRLSRDERTTIRRIIEEMDE